MKKTGIYKITSPSKKVYIGQSKRISERFSAYKKLKCKSQPRLYTSFIKYGFENHIFEIIEECSSESLNARERYWQEFYNVIGLNGLNCMYVNTDKKKAIMYEEFSIKTSISKIGNKNMLGKKHSEDTKKKLSLMFKGCKHTEEAREKIIKSLIGHKVSEETRAKISKTNTGKKRSEETKINISNSLKGRKLSEECLKKRSITLNSRPSPTGRMVLNIETGIYYDSIIEASIAYGINHRTLQNRFSRDKNKGSIIYA